MSLLCEDAMHDAAKKGDNALVTKLLDSGVVEVNKKNAVSPHTHRLYMYVTFRVLWSIDKTFLRLSQLDSTSECKGRTGESVLNLVDCMPDMLWCMLGCTTLVGILQGGP